MLDESALFVYNCKRSGGGRRTGRARRDQSDRRYDHDECVFRCSGKRRNQTQYYNISEYRQKTLELRSAKWYANHYTDINIAIMVQMTTISHRWLFFAH